ncbi:MAG: hypothetical protein KGR98_00075, partial [Verrucomicrobia bacterium]|nr:hypothetical protein [Verrucomicrobiota bacterium]
MTTRKQFRRALALALTLCGAFAGLGYRLVDLQVLRHGQLATVAEQSAEHEFWEAPRRGDILDIHGNPLGTSVSVETVCADPSAMRGEQALVARTIAPLLRMNDADVYPRLFPVVGRDRGGLLVTNHLYYAPLCKDVSEDTWKKIHLAMQNLRVAGSGRAFDLSLYELRHEAIFAEPSQMRVYPNGALAAQVLGFCTMKDVDMEGHVISQMAGRDGIEAALNPVLTGVAGWQVAGMDGNRRELIPMRDEDVQPRDGLNVVLTIDSVIQHIVESALADAMQKHSPLDATAIVVRPQTGEILALASLPAYDPNHLNTVTTKTRDRVITDVMEPGSTFKIVTVSGALNDGVVHLNDVFDCHHGSCVFFGRTLHD